MSAPRRLEAAVLLMLGIGMGVFALAGPYERLMNPDFRVVTVVGAVLIVLMGLVLLVWPHRQGNSGALIVFGGLFVLVVVGRPFAPGLTPFLAEGALPPPLERDGYAPLEARALFRTLDEETDVDEGTYVLSGIVYRSAALDKDGVFVLLDPIMACCLADAVALGVRVEGAAPPPDGAWIYVYGALRRLAAPAFTPAFRVGAIVFTNVSRRYAVEAHDVVTFISLLAPVVDQVPSERCALFKAALESSGLAEMLRGDGPYTVFVPLDLALERVPEARRVQRSFLEQFVVAGRISESGLYGRTSLKTLSGRELSVEIVNGSLRIEGARVLFGDQVARNGLLHVVHPMWSPRDD